MGMFGTSALERVNEGFEDIGSITEMFVVQEAMRMSSDELKAWCESEEADALVEANVLRKPTLMRLSKMDDEKRRRKLAAFGMAKTANDPLWTALTKNRVKEKQLIEKIMTKYGNKAERIAKAAQKEYIKSYGKDKKKK